MKNKINAKRILVMFGIVFLFASCEGSKNEVEYINVIQDMSGDKNKKMILVRDVKTNDVRFYTIPRMGWFGTMPFYDSEYFHIGDTVKLCTSEKHYTNQRVFRDGDQVKLAYNKDSVQARKAYEKFEQERQNFDKLKQNAVQEKQK